MGVAHASCRRGPGIRGIAARAFKSFNYFKNLFALGAGNEADNNFDPGFGIGKQPANVRKNGK